MACPRPHPLNRSTQYCGIDAAVHTLRCSTVAVPWSEDSPQIGVGAPRLVPVAGIAERDLLEVHAVRKAARPHMEVTVDHRAGAKAPVPIGRGAGAAPGR